MVDDNACGEPTGAAPAAAERLWSELLALPTVLGAVAGYVDAVGFQRLLGGVPSGHTPSVLGERAALGFVVLASVLVAYLAGAAVGASPVGEWEWALVLPTAVLAVVVGVVAWRPAVFLPRD